MGQIDENAISSLSLVVNLSKHIQTSSKASNEDIQQYLPAFLWVLRDFSLQLCDEQDNDISSQEYLELTLKQGGNNMEDPKAVIRSSIKKFFSNRDCCTLVRPLVEEDKLQVLESLDLEQLRPEFVEQVVALRRKVLNKMPIKRINGQNLDGLSWVNLLRAFVKSINSGSVPNIESSWKYICKQRAEAALKHATE